MAKFISNSGYEPKYGKLLHTLKKRKAVYQFFQDAEEETFIYFVKKTKTGTERSLIILKDLQLFIDFYLNNRWKEE
jgi:hypothetical protein